MKGQKEAVMKQFDFVVQTSVGIHARPAMQLVNMTKKFQSDIKLSYNGNSANAKNIVSVLMLHANQGAEVVFLINGPDEEEAYKQLRKFCKTDQNKSALLDHFQIIIQDLSRKSPYDMPIIFIE